MDSIQEEGVYTYSDVDDHVDEDAVEDRDNLYYHGRVEVVECLMCTPVVCYVHKEGIHLLAVHSDDEACQLGCFWAPFLYFLFLPTYHSLW